MDIFRVLLADEEAERHELIGRLEE
jgi:hypothetical protein